MSLFLVSYTDKAIAVFGDISKYENALLKLGGKFNPNLNYQGERKAGFIFPKTKSTIVAGFVQNPVETTKISDGAKVSESKTESSRHSEKNVKDTLLQDNKKDVIMLSREQFLNLVNTLNRLEQDVAYLKKVVAQNNPSSKVTEPITIPVEKISTRVIESKKNINKEENKQSEEKKWADEISDQSDDYSENLYETEGEIELPKLLKPKIAKKNEKNETSRTSEKVEKKPQSLLLKSLDSSRGNK